MINYEKEVGNLFTRFLQYLFQTNGKAQRLIAHYGSPSVVFKNLKMKPENGEATGNCNIEEFKKLVEEKEKE